jgi:putative ABC transport system permease protein
MAGLLTSRGPARAREMAVRSAIGAGRSGLVRQLMTESVLLSIGGGILGIALGYVSMRVFRHIQIPTDLPIGPTFDLDRRALAFSLIVACASALLFGLVPAIQTSRVDLTAVMTGPARDRSGRSLGGTAGHCDVHLSSVPERADQRSRLSDRSPAPDVGRHRSHAVHGQRIEPVL